MTAQQYWIGKVAVVEWALTTLDGTAVDDATVVGTVTRPDGTTTAMTVTAPDAGSGNPYRVSYDPVGAGLHAYRVEASGSVDDAEEGTFVVRPSLTGAPTITTDPTTAIGAIRLLISDVDLVSPVFSDAEITAFYAMNASNVRLGAAQALDAIAVSEILVSKVIETLDLKTNGAATGAALRAQAQTLRDTAADYLPDGSLFAMTIVDYVPYRWPGDELAEATRCP